MFSKYDKSKAASLEAFPSVARLASEGSLTFSEAAEAMYARGEISREDPRMQIDPVQVSKLSSLRMSELMTNFEKIASDQKNNGADAATRARYAAVVMAGADTLKPLDDLAHKRPDLATQAEFMAFRMTKADPRNPAARDMMALAAAASNSQIRERASRGFETGNIAKAAKTQGRSWIAVRDDLVRFGALSDADPRRKIRNADVLDQAGGIIKRSNTLPADHLEDVAMRRLKKNPKDELATAWLATAGSLASDNVPGKVKGAEVAGILPAKGKLFGSVIAKKRAAGFELG
ncbi:hypothetical protein ACOI1H_20205 [Loktanella sp. DJP18]|uniref:hypothetical protein n=1 Tax=Loktanella sp. DJP18 TaxID=3409788 RepID=UPI003BB772C2